MNRHYWTVYDDDISRDFEQELTNEETVDINFDRVLETVLKRLTIEQSQLDHFEQESDLFEV
jgi:hypothetical protein